MTKLTKKNILVAGLGVLAFGMLGTSMNFQYHTKRRIQNIQNILITMEQDVVGRFLQNAFGIFGVPKKGLIHIGAHHAEEIKVYDKLSIPHTLWIEANPEAEEKLKKALEPYAKASYAIFAVSDKPGTAQLYVDPQEVSSSLMPVNKSVHGTVDHTKTLTVPTHRLDDYLKTYALAKDVNIIVIDIEGGELQALKGAIETLKQIDVIIAEIQYDERYKGGTTLEDLDSFLLEQGFVRVESQARRRTWGDGLYIKKRFLKQN